MAKWDFDISSVGSMLHRAIHESTEDSSGCKQVLQILVSCYDYLKRVLPSEMYDRRFSCGEEQARDALLETEEPCLLYAYVLDVTNEALMTFYDLCDENRIWVGV